MGDEPSDMWAELSSNTAETGWAIGEEEAGYFDDMNWEPTPIDAAPGKKIYAATFLIGRLSQNNIWGHHLDIVEYL
jgi:hypothetical protein